MLRAKIRYSFRQQDSQAHIVITMEEDINRQKSAGQLMGFIQRIGAFTTKRHLDGESNFTITKHVTVTGPASLYNACVECKDALAMLGISAEIEKTNAPHLRLVG